MFQLLLEHAELVYLLGNAAELTEEYSPETRNSPLSQTNFCHMKPI